MSCEKEGRRERLERCERKQIVIKKIYVALTGLENLSDFWPGAIALGYLQDYCALSGRKENGWKKIYTNCEPLTKGARKDKNL